MSSMSSSVIIRPPFRSRRTVPDDARIMPDAAAAAVDEAQSGAIPTIGKPARAENPFAVAEKPVQIGSFPGFWTTRGTAAKNRPHPHDLNRVLHGFLHKKNPCCSASFLCDSALIGTVFSPQRGNRQRGANGSTARGKTRQGLVPWVGDPMVGGAGQPGEMVARSGRSDSRHNLGRRRVKGAVFRNRS